MAILVKCKCGRRFRFKQKFAGKHTNCSVCRAPMVVSGNRVPDHDVFISYSHLDQRIADSVCASLEAGKIRCWIAHRDIGPGDKWARAIVDAINECSVLVLVFTENSNASPQVLREVDCAVNSGKSIVPFRIDAISPSKALEYYISTAHWLDAMAPPVESHLKRLETGVRSLLDVMGDSGCSEAEVPGLRRFGHDGSVKRVWRVVAAYAAIVVLLLAGAWGAFSMWSKHDLVKENEGDRMVATESPTVHSPTTRSNERRTEAPQAPPAPTPADPWLGVSGGQKEVISVSRHQRLQGLRDYEVDEALRVVLNSNAGATRGTAFSADDNAAENTSFPPYFCLVGRLLGVRGCWLFLGSDYPPPITDDSTESLPRLTRKCIGVYFDNWRLPDWTTDYCVGDRVRVVVFPSNWCELPAASISEQLAHGLLSIKLSLNRRYLTEFFMLQDPRVPAPIPCWSLRGLALEVIDMRRTWAVAGEPRIVAPPPLGGNATVGVLFRNPDGISDEEGAVIGRFRSVAVENGNTIVRFVVDNTIEGSVPIIANLGVQMAPSAFAEYSSDKTMIRAEGRVEGAVFDTDSEDPTALGTLLIGSLNSDVSELFPCRTLSHPLTTYNAIKMECRDIKAVTGPPGESGLHAAITPSYIMSHPNDSGIFGREVTWMGKLHRIRCRNGETHVECESIASRRSSRFEGVTTDSEFLEDTRDYQDLADGSRQSDTVSIHGVLAKPESVAWRINQGYPLVEIREIMRVGEPFSRVIVGRRRDSLSIVPNRGPANESLEWILRSGPPIGQRVSFRADFNWFEDMSQENTVHVSQGTRHGRAHIHFPKSTSADFRDYRSGDRVEVEAILVELDGNEPQFLGKRIVVIEMPNTLVTDEGRPLKALDWSNAIEEWKPFQYQYDLKQHIGRRLQIAGEFHRATKGSEASVSLRSLFFERNGGSKSFRYFAVNSAAREFLEELKQGERIIGEVIVRDTASSKASRPGRGGSRSRDSDRRLNGSSPPAAHPEWVIVWLARLGDPENKVRFDAR